MKPKKPLNETNEERFKRVAEARTNAVLEKIRLLGNCSNNRLYRYSENDIEKIFNAINIQLKEAKQKFSSPDQRKKFKL